MSGFRRSRVAMLIDLALLPLGIVKGVLLGGVPAVCEELRRWPRDFVRNWRAAGWISEHNAEAQRLAVASTLTPLVGNSESEGERDGR